MPKSDLYSLGDPAQSESHFYVPMAAPVQHGCGADYLAALADLTALTLPLIPAYRSLSEAAGRELPKGNQFDPRRALDGAAL